MITEAMRFIEEADAVISMEDKEFVAKYAFRTGDTDLVKKLIDLGYLNQLLLTCDLCLKNLLHSYGGWGYDHVLTNIVPMMEDEGVTDEQIKTMLVDNPANWLC